jgi:putative ABC transport system permease protein
MRIIIKFILKNIQEKKFRTLLILLSITLSSALFFASTAISGTIEQMYMQRIKKYIGTADIIIHPNEKSPSDFFHTAQAMQFPNLTEYVVGAIENSATYKNRKETVNIDLKGFTLEDLQTMNPFILEEHWQLRPFTGKKIIISKATADKYHWKIGDKLELKLSDNRYRFRICGIAEPTGFFQEDGRSNTAVVPRETLASFYNASGKVSMIYIKLKDRRQIGDCISRLAKLYRRYTVREPISWEELQQYIRQISAPFMLMVVLVLFMSVFIIYTSFKVITRERLPVIGTFRSIGATKRTTDMVMFTESILYGVIGGVLGWILGLGILYIMSILMTPQWMKGTVHTSINFTAIQLVMALILAVVLALVSSFIPIVKISKIPVKDIILNSIVKNKTRKSSKLIWGILCLVMAYVAPLFSPKEFIFPVTMFGMAMVITAIVILIPFITKGFTKFFERIFVYIFGNEGILAAKNLRENQSIINNISLLAIGISSLLMINTISYSVGKEVLNVYRDAKFDIWMGVGGADRSFKARLFSVIGVKDVYGLYSTYNVEMEGRKDRIQWFAGANKNSFFKFWDVELLGDQAAILKKFDDSRNILLSTTLKDKFGVGIGDYLTIKTKRGNKAYKIIGFFNSLMQDGNFSIIPERYLKSDMKERYYSDLFIKTTQTPAVIEAKLKKKFQREQPFIMTMTDMEKRNMQSNARMFFILQGFSVLALLIGIFGVFNNLIISFIERKRSLAVMHSVGMSKAQSLKMIFIESLSGGLIGGIVGMTAGLLLISLIPYMMKALNIPIPMHYSLTQFLLALLAGIIITVIASISPAFQSTKLNIIEAIKYE